MFRALKIIKLCHAEQENHSKESFPSKPKSKIKEPADLSSEPNNEPLLSVPLNQHEEAIALTPEPITDLSPEVQGAKNYVMDSEPEASGFLILASGDSTKNTQIQNLSVEINENVVIDDLRDPDKSEDIDIMNNSSSSSNTSGVLAFVDSFHGLQEKTFACSMSSEEVKAQKAVSLSKRKWNRRNCCPYCMKQVTNFRLHLINYHSEETEVIEYMMELDPDLKARRMKRIAISNKIRYKGNYLFNIQQKPGDELIPSRRPSGKKKYTVTSSTHAACKYCLSVIKKESLYLHVAHRHPESKDEHYSKGNTVLKSASLLLIPDMKEASTILKEQVYPSMRKDEITTIAQTDPFIVKFGSKMLSNHLEKHQVRFRSYKMRDLARVLLKMKEHNPELQDFTECLLPKNFDSLMNVIRELSGFNESTGEVKVPSFPPRIRSSLQISADIITAEAIKSTDSMATYKRDEIIKTMDNFQKLLKNEWRFEISSNAKRTRKRLACTKDDIMPIDEDVRTVFQGIRKLLPGLRKKLIEDPTPLNFDELNKHLIAQICVFCRRRPGETTRITLDLYQKISGEEETSKFDESILTPAQLEAYKSLFTFYIPGKLVRKVPVMLDHEMKLSTDLLLAYRDKVGIAKDNDLLFCKPYSSDFYVGSKVIKNITSKFKLIKPEYFTATGLRHHVATESQCHDPDERYTANLASCMGHTLAVHNSNYRLPVKMIHTAVVGERLLRMTNEKQVLKNLSNTHRNISQKLSNKISATTTTVDKQKEICLSPVKLKKRKGTVVDDSDDSDSLVLKNPKKKRCKVVVRKWGAEEKQIIIRHFGEEIRQNKNPNRDELKRVHEAYEILRDRPINSFFTFINNCVTKKTKLF